MKAGEEIAKNPRRFFGARVAEGHFIDPDDRREGAAAQAGDGFDGELAGLVGVLAGLDPQVAAQGVLDALRAGHMAGGSAAHANDILADGLMPEVVIERSHSRHGRRRDLRGLANAAERFLGQVAIVILNRLEDRDNRGRFAPNPLDGLVYKCELNGHGHPVRERWRLWRARWPGTRRSSRPADKPGPARSPGWRGMSHSVDRGRLP